MFCSFNLLCMQTFYFLKCCLCIAESCISNNVVQHAHIQCSNFLLFIYWQAVNIFSQKQSLNVIYYSHIVWFSHAVFHMCRVSLVVCQSFNCAVVVRSLRHFSISMQQCFMISATVQPQIWLFLSSACIIISNIYVQCVLVKAVFV